MTQEEKQSAKSRLWESLQDKQLGFFHLKNNNKTVLYICVSFAVSHTGLSLCETAKETQMYRTVFWTLWGRGGDDLGEWY